MFAEFIQIASRLLSSPSSRRRRHRSCFAPEALEARLLLAADVSFSVINAADAWPFVGRARAIEYDGVILLLGDSEAPTGSASANDDVWISELPSSNGTHVELRIELRTGDQWKEDRSDFRTEYLYDNILALRYLIYFQGYAGDDRFVNDTRVDSLAGGGAGNDRLYGGWGHDTFEGGGGHNSVFGGIDYLHDELSRGDASQRDYRNPGSTRILHWENVRYEYEDFFIDYLKQESTPQLTVEVVFEDSSDAFPFMPQGDPRHEHRWQLWQITVIDRALHDIVVATEGVGFLQKTASSGARPSDGYLIFRKAIRHEEGRARGVNSNYDGSITIYNDADDEYGAWTRFLDDEMNRALLNVVIHELAHGLHSQPLPYSTIGEVYPALAGTDHVFVRESWISRLEYKLLHPSKRAPFAAETRPAGPVSNYYRTHEQFYRDYAKSNPSEDYAVIFEAWLKYYRDSPGDHLTLKAFDSLLTSSAGIQIDPGYGVGDIPVLRAGRRKLYYALQIMNHVRLNNILDRLKADFYWENPSLRRSYRDDNKNWLREFYGWADFSPMFADRIRMVGAAPPWPQEMTDYLPGLNLTDPHDTGKTPVFVDSRFNAARARLRAPAGQLLRLNLKAEDPEGSLVAKYLLTAGPDGAAVHPQDGEFLWEPGPGDVGQQHTFVVIAEAQNGDYARTEFTIFVESVFLEVQSFVVTPAVIPDDGSVPIQLFVANQDGPGVNNDIDAVHFYLDSNDDGELDPGVDRGLYRGREVPGGWSWLGGTGPLPIGRHRLLAEVSWYTGQHEFTDVAEVFVDVVAAEARPEQVRQESYERLGIEDAARGPEFLVHFSFNNETAMKRTSFVTDADGVIQAQRTGSGSGTFPTRPLAMEGLKAHDGYFATTLSRQDDRDGSFLTLYQLDLANPDHRDLALIRWSGTPTIQNGDWVVPAVDALPVAPISELGNIWPRSLVLDGDRDGNVIAAWHAGDYFSEKTRFRLFDHRGGSEQNELRAVSPVIEIGEASRRPQVAVLPNGNFFVAWHNNSAELEQRRVRAQVFGPGGETVTTPFDVSDESHPVLSRPLVDLKVNSAGDVAILMRLSGDETFNGISTAYIRRYLSDGTPIDMTVRQVNHTADVTPLSLAQHDSGRMVVTYRRPDNMVVGQLVDQFAVLRGSEFEIGSDIWSASAYFSGSEIYVQHPRGAGTAAPEEIQVTKFRAPTLPDLSPLAPMTGLIGEPLEFTPNFQQNLSDANDVLFSLEPLTADVPEGATIDPATGEFTWTPLAEQAGTEHQFLIRYGVPGSRTAYAQQVVRVRILNPAVPEISDPDGHQETGDVVLTWPEVPDAVRYHVRIFSGSNEEVLRFSDLSEPAWRTSEPLPDGTYHVEVQAEDGTGRTSGWGATGTLEVDVPTPGAPTITAPESGAVASLPVISWTSVADHFMNYDVWVADDEQGTDAVLRTMVQNETSLVFADGDRGFTDGYYRVWVRGVNSSGEAGPWSASRGFRIDQPRPERVELTRTAQESESAFPLLTWYGVEGAESYDLWVSRQGETAIFLRDSAVAQALYAAPTAWPEGAYTYWVRAQNVSEEYGPWSIAGQLEISVPRPDRADVSTVPSVMTDPTAGFSWPEVPGAASYEIWVDQLLPQRKSAWIHETVTFPEFQPDEPLLHGSYHLWVRAVNDAAEAGTWSPVRELTVDAPELTAGYLDATLGWSQRTQSWAYDWTGKREYWFRDGERRWYYILPNGTIYRQHTSGGADTLITALPEFYYMNPDALVNASAAWHDFRLGLTSLNSENPNDFLGRSERWIVGNFGLEYFLTPDGSLVRDIGLTPDGQQASVGDEVEQLHRQYFENPERLTRAFAWYLDARLQLSSNGDYFEDWGGLGEKWLQDANDRWLYLTPAGRLYDWDEAAGLANGLKGQLLAEIGAEYFDEPVRLTQATQDLQIAPHGFDRETVELRGRVFADANGNGRLDDEEKPDGQQTIELLDADGNVLATTTSAGIDFDRDGRIGDATEVGWFGFYNWPAGTYSVRVRDLEPTDRVTWLDPLHRFAAALVDEQSLRRAGGADDYLNWAGLNEKWLIGNDGWFYITEDGGLFRWNDLSGGDFGGQKVVQLTADYYESLDLLADAAVAGPFRRTLGEGRKIDDLLLLINQGD